MAQNGVVVNATANGEHHSKGVQVPGASEDACLLAAAQGGLRPSTFKSLNASCRLPPQRCAQVCQARLYIPHVLSTHDRLGALGGYARGKPCLFTINFVGHSSSDRPIHLESQSSPLLQLEVVNMHRTGELARLVAIAKQTDLTFNLVGRQRGRAHRLQGARDVVPPLCCSHNSVTILWSLQTTKSQRGRVQPCRSTKPYLPLMQPPPCT